MDIIFCTLVVPGMMFLFPASEWLRWHPDYVLLFSLWLYGVWLVCRVAIGPAILQKYGGVLAASSLFLIAIVNFLLTLTPVNFPNAYGVRGMPLHERAMWILLLAVISEGVPVGALSARNKDLKAEKEEEETVQNARHALEKRKAEALSPDEELPLKAGYKTVYVPISAIQYIEGRNNYACVHIDHMDDVVSQIPLKDVMELLPKGKFVRIQRSYIVPVWRIESASATQVKLMGVDGTLPVGRAYKDELKKVKA